MRTTLVHANGPSPIHAGPDGPLPTSRREHPGRAPCRRSALPPELATRTLPVARGRARLIAADR